MAYCTSCGAALDAGTTFCTTCGARVLPQPAPLPPARQTVAQLPAATGSPLTWLLKLFAGLNALVGSVAAFYLLDTLGVWPGLGALLASIQSAALLWVLAETREAVGRLNR